MMMDNDDDYDCSDDGHDVDADAGDDDIGDVCVNYDANIQFLRSF